VRTLAQFQSAFREFADALGKNPPTQDDDLRKLSNLLMDIRSYAWIVMGVSLEDDFYDPSDMGAKVDRSTQ